MLMWKLCGYVEPSEIMSFACCFLYCPYLQLETISKNKKKDKEKKKKNILVEYLVS